MSIGTSALARKQLDRRIDPVRRLQLAPPPRGWMRAIRDALGMSSRQLARRMGVAPSRISAIERAEISGTTTIRTLRQAAAAMDCAFVYAFVPRAPLEEIVRQRVEHIVDGEMSALSHTMALENQSALAADTDDLRRKAVDARLSSSLRGLWDERP